jgi:hypothetical protein
MQNLLRHYQKASQPKKVLRSFKRMKTSETGLCVKVWGAWNTSGQRLEYMDKELSKWIQITTRNRMDYKDKN